MTPRERDPTRDAAPRALTVEPIGVVRTPFQDRVSAPRQPHAAEGAAGRIELVPGRSLEHAVSDLDAWDRIWVLFWFHLNAGWRPKVLPPRSAGKRRGVLATRSPHRPNPIGLSVVRLDRVDGLVLHVRDVDMVDGTPVLDLKPYVPYADAHPDASTGWIEPLAGEAPRDPEPGFEVAWAPAAAEQLEWLRRTQNVDLEDRATRVLSLGPQPHPYRRIRAEGDGFVLAIKDWRVRFRVQGRRVEVSRIATGYRPKQLARDPDAALDAHRAFVAAYGH